VLPFATGSADIPVGTPILVMVEDEEDVAAFANYEATAATPAPAAAPDATPVTAPTPTPVVAPSPGTTAAPVLSASNSALDGALKAAAKAAFDTKYPNGITA
jgi:pyruvate dehydrogenase E2 component (dihydrolipoamide acetyltransferase)